MKLIAFSKLFQDKSIEELIEMALEHGLDGYDLTVRPGHPVDPDNAAVELPRAVERMRAAGLDIPMVTGNFDLLGPDHPTAEPILSAMDRADVRLLKLGYFKFEPESMDYWAEVDRVRAIFERWEQMSRKHNVKICYHTHSNRCMGLNCAALMHLLRGLDPECMGAYIDTGHMAVEGEEFAVGAAMVRDFLSIVSLKDGMHLREERNGHGFAHRIMMPAGEGVVDWTAVFDCLVRMGFDGPLSIHCEFEVEPEKFMPTAEREFAFFKRMLAEAEAGQ